MNKHCSGSSVVISFVCILQLLLLMLLLLLLFLFLFCRCFLFCCFLLLLLLLFFLCFLHAHTHTHTAFRAFFQPLQVDVSGDTELAAWRLRRLCGHCQVRVFPSLFSLSSSSSLFLFFSFFLFLFLSFFINCSFQIYREFLYDYFVVMFLVFCFNLRSFQLYFFITFAIILVLFLLFLLLLLLFLSGPHPLFRHLFNVVSSSSTHPLRKGGKTSESGSLSSPRILPLFLFSVIVLPV